MSYRITYAVAVDWVGPGTNVMTGASWPGAVNAAGASVVGPGAPVGMASAGGAQRKMFFNGTSSGQNSGTFLSADITALTNAMAADIAAQMNLAPNIAQIQGFATGGG